MSTIDKERYQSTLKHPDTEETIDLLFYRPLGYRFALWAEKHGVVPNAISVLSIFLGVGAGLLFYPADWRLNLPGILLLIAADICDSADGQLARMTGRFSRLGRILDGVCGDLWFITIYIAICCRLDFEWGWSIWILAAAAGACHSLQAAMADYYRNFHLFFVKGRSGSELEDARQVAADYRAISFRREPLYKVFMFFYRNYTREQEFFTPQMQRLRAQLRLRFGDRPIPVPLCNAFRVFSLPLMKYTNILSFNCRAILLSVTLLAGEPWIYFVGELTLFNLLLLYMITRHEIICRRFARRLETAA
jgi:phosphatidylglycerophosphate synthase